MQPRVLLLGDELADLVAELRFVEVVRRVAGANGDVGGGVAVAFADGQEQFQQAVLHRRRRVADHAEVEQGDLVIAREKNVSRMRIGVEGAVEQDLFEVGLEEFLRQAGTVDLEAGQRAQFRDLGAFDVIHREDPVRGVIRDRQRHAQASELLQVFRERCPTRSRTWSAVSTSE